MRMTSLRAQNCIECVDLRSTMRSLIGRSLVVESRSADCRSRAAAVLRCVFCTVAKFQGPIHSSTVRAIFLLIIGAGLRRRRATRGPTRASRASTPSRAAKGDILLVARNHASSSSRVRAGATLASVLRAHDVAVADVAAIVAQAASVFDLRKVRANQPYRLETTHAGTVRGFEYEIDGDRFLRVGRSPDDALVASRAADSEDAQRRGGERPDRSRAHRRWWRRSTPRARRSI